MQARGSGGAPALHTGGQDARARVPRACSHCDRSVSPRHRRSPRGGCLLAAQRHSDAQHACTWRSIHAAGARRSRATGSSQRAGELTGADPANRAPLAHPRQLAGRSWPRIRRRGARFGDGLETDHLNGRPGGREATRCAVRPLRGAGDTTATLGGGPYMFRHHRCLRTFNSVFSLGRFGPGRRPKQPLPKGSLLLRPTSPTLSPRPHPYVLICFTVTKRGAQLCGQSWSRFYHDQ